MKQLFTFLLCISSSSLLSYCQKPWDFNGNNVFNTNTENVGVGIANPTQKLHVNGRLLLTGGFSADNAALVYNNSSDYLFFGPVSGSALQGGSITLYGNTNTVGANPGGINFNVSNANTTAMKIMANGNVSIGTISPHQNALLHIDLGTSIANGFLVTGKATEPNSSVPTLGRGTRMMFFPGKSAFRAGTTNGDEWDNFNVGFFSTAIGIDTKASGGISTALGSGTIASGYISTAIGSLSSATAPFSVAIGHGNIASGNGSLAIGFSSKSTGAGATSMGTQTIAGGHSSTTLGVSTIAKGYASTVIGMYNNPILTTDQTSISQMGPGTPLFIIGNGDINGLTPITSNAMVVLKNGNVGIGINTPTNKLHVIGNICATGTIFSCSDIRYKKNIFPVNNVLSHLLSLHGIYYKWNKEEFKDKGFTEERQIGFSAQEIEKFFPEIVQTNTEGYKAIDYGRLTPILVEAIKEQQKQIDSLKTEFMELKMMLKK